MTPVSIALGAATAPMNSEQAANVEAWTEQATEALKAVSLSDTNVPNGIRGTSVNLSIPLDGSQQELTANVMTERLTATTIPPWNSTSGRRHREPIHRDSLKRREALLKGKEGSRQRRRWENDRLLNNPHAVPPLPSDWVVGPTYPRHAVPYYLAPLWDEEAYHRSLERKREMKKAKTAAQSGTSVEDPNAEGAFHIPKEVRTKLKRARAAKGLLQDLEEDVRHFVQQWSEKQIRLHNEGLHDVDSDTSDDEVVFVGRNGLMHDSPSRRKEVQNEPRRDKLVFDGLADDKGASFGRWLVHSLATYYGLRTWSVTVGDPARREAYVGIRERAAETSRRNGDRSKGIGAGLPRPLWCMV